MFYEHHPQQVHAPNSTDTLILVFNYLHSAPPLATSFLKHFLALLTFYNMASSWFFLFFMYIILWYDTKVNK